jgi:membrane protease YdiL (CAAX protease family)
MLHYRDMGLANARRSLGRLAVGFAIGFASLASAAGLAILCGGRTANLAHTAPELFHILAGATATAIVVAILEELIFRAALFGILRKAMAWPAALAISSAVYAAVHFLQKAATTQPVDWLSGFRLLPELFRVPLGQPGLAPAFFTLLLAGAILALAYQRTGSLFMSIGLHAGWIFWLTACRSLTREAPGASRAIWGGDKLIDGWLSFVILAVVLAGVWRGGRAAPGAASGEAS